MPRYTRRKFVGSAAALGALNGASAASRNEPTLANAGVYSRLGVRPVINGMGTVTVLGGSLMPPEVVRAMEEASKFFVNLPELQKKAGQRLAGLIGVPAALVTTGAAGSITMAAAACLTRGDRDKLDRLPDTEGMPFEVIQQKSHRSGYEAQMRLTGARIVWVETREEAERAIGPRTAMMFYMNKAEGNISRQDWIALGKKHGIPLFNDAAADVPPSGRLSSVYQEGFDLVAFSGGKGLRGPQCSGLLLGRKDLVEAAAMAISPNGGIGRGMKVGKEEIVGLVAAVERYVKADIDGEIRVLDNKVSEMMRLLAGLDGVNAEKEVPRIANEVPHLALTWNEKAKGKTTRQIHQALLDGDPPIATLPQGEGKLTVSVWMMQGGEHRTVARRLKELLA
jgi:L-seryl-tRNA(Ser) seleniumtransferase